ncbi:LytR/AlgR family response regulator transcription factor [Niabella beijingensis]|uniref:LytR/AlgR family response regulator transcription factor n=1 Tax=Niabella beijingensis TaxID=2872700 RepID=UPI001CBBB43A|nr:LytTR family DNA-binding domain-containing protein [Niabella beijingensis]MBZ4188722.1 LytTR family DNA-binding domain-containing protein [Niabella beijingensis]
MKAIIIDDEPNNIRNLELLLKEHCSNVQVVATAMNADEGREAILSHQPDLVFLDIQMPGANGFEMLQSLPEPGFEVIFVTGFDRYGIQAVKFSAIDYLLKPIVTAELKTAVEKAAHKTETKKRNTQLENLLKFLEKKDHKQDHKIALPSAKETRFVNPAQIIYCEAKNNYTSFRLTGGEQLVISRPLYEYEELLTDYGFLRCHNSYLVNRIFIKSILKEDSTTLLLENDERIPVSRQKKEYIKNLLLKNS